MEINNNYGWKLILNGDESLLDNSIIGELKERAETIYFNDATGTHFIMCFKVQNVWFESTKVDMVNQIIEYLIFK